MAHLITPLSYGCRLFAFPFYFSPVMFGLSSQLYTAYCLMLNLAEKKLLADTD